MIKNIDPYEVEEIGYHLNLIKNLVNVTQDSFDTIATSAVKYQNGECNADELANDCVITSQKIDTLLTVLFDKSSDAESDIYAIVNKSIHTSEESKEV
ncbi:MULTISPECIES: hypothetical protein [Companilactobacillus]|uniref:Uncharacterized protein n=1 Tax=Companilactobacillus futsaii TaxID=938155 RepID=A0A5B7T1D0_9LACO|nr:MULTISPECIES: hypothetical protein [Companilactobacillus]QCX25756.1 hypothetical protein FG051_11930 [Companilactobacillus futsaii]